MITKNHLKKHNQQFLKAVAAVAAATTAAAATATIAAAKALSSCEDGARERPLFTCF